MANGARQIHLGDTSPTRDFSHVSDTTRGFLAALDSVAGLGETFNLGSNFEISIGDTALLIAEQMGARIEIMTDDARIRPAGSEVQRLLADNCKARSMLDWEPQFAGVNGFKRGLRETIDWFAQPENIQKYRSDIYNI